MAGPGTPDGAGSRLVTLAMQLAALLVAAIVSVSFVAFVGAVVLWSRFEAAKLPADQAVAIQPEADLVTVGAIALVLFVLGGLLAVLLLKLLNEDGRLTLPTRRGLLVVVALEILAGYLVEDWEEMTGVILIGVAAIGVIGLGALLEQAACWIPHHRGEPFPAFLRRARMVFVRGVQGVSRTRLWAALGVLTAAVVALAAVSPWRERYIAGALALALGLVIALLPHKSGVQRRWGIVLAAVALVAAAAAVLIHESGWLATVAGIAVLLGAVNLAVAHLTGDFFPLYGLTAFVSVALFGAAFNFLRGLGNPHAQGIALLRTNDAQPLCGIFVGETENRLYYGRVDGDGSAETRRLRGGSGRLLWAPRDRVAAAEIGPLEPVGRAQETAVRLQREVALGAEPTEVATPTRVTAPTAVAASAAGQDPCGPAPVRSALRKTPERAQAARYQPRLILSASDSFWPVSLHTLFDLRWRGKVLCRAPTCAAVRSPADLPFTGGENEWLEYPGSHTSRGQQRDLMIAALRTADPFRSARQYFLTAKDPASGTTSLQYWYFYTFNYQPLKIGLAGFHEGDFEHVGVLLSRQGEPRAVWMARHDDEGQVLLWGEPALGTRETHADVYVARGSHASYESCIEQQRRRAPLGFINDRPECEGSRQVVLEPGQVPLLDLAHARWACWAGRFGHTRSGVSKLEWQHVEANGPRSPLHQQSYDGVVSSPCRDVDLPEEVPSEGEEPLPGASAAGIRGGAGRLDALVDECEDWQRPQPQGAYVAACAPLPLERWVRGGMPAGAAPGLQVLAKGDTAPRDRMPIAVRRDALQSSFEGWRLRAAERDAIVVYASCYVGRTPLEATFRGVAVEPDGELRLDHSAHAAWRILDAAGRTVAEATPRVPGEADGPNAPRKPPSSTYCR